MACDRCKKLLEVVAVLQQGNDELRAIWQSHHVSDNPDIAKLLLIATKQSQEIWNRIDAVKKAIAAEDN